MPGPQKKIWLPIAEASAWAIANGIKNRKEWKSLGDRRPEGFPAAVEYAYGEMFYELGGWGGFLGTGRLSTSQREFKSIEEASQWAQEHNVQSSTEWKRLDKPNDIPGNPFQTYGAEAFREIGGWGGFLGTQKRRPGTIKYRSFYDCLEWIRSNNIKNKIEWDNGNLVKPNDIPASIDRIYPEDFVAIGGWNGVFGVQKIRQFSQIERLIRLVLDDTFEVNAPPHRKQSAVGLSTKKHQIDIAYENLNLIIEFDGFYFHQNRENKDISKTKDLQLSLNNWNVLRIREEGLNLLDPIWNVHVPTSGLHQNVIQIVLLHILKLNKNGYLKISKTHENKMRNFIKNPDISKHYDTLFKFLKIATIEESSQWAIENKIQNKSQWRNLKTKKPSHIPSRPEVIYGQKFIEIGGWDGFLGIQYANEISQTSKKLSLK